MRLSKKKSAEWQCDPTFSCAVDVTLSVIGGKWKLLILANLFRAHLAGNVVRFGQLRRQLTGITQTMLTQQLRELEEDGIVKRTVFAEIPPRVEYELTEFGRTLDDVMSVMNVWGEQYAAMVVEKKRQARGLEAAVAAAGAVAAVAAD